jgi:hypothetical protein
MGVRTRAEADWAVRAAAGHDGEGPFLKDAHMSRNGQTQVIICAP